MCSGCAKRVEDDPEWGFVTWQDRVYYSVECSVAHERRLSRNARTLTSSEGPVA